MSKPYIDPLFSELILTGDQLKAIGCLEVEAALLEFTIEDMASYISNLDQEFIHALVAENAPISTKLSNLKNLIFYKTDDKEVRGEFMALHAQITEHLKNRNIVTHAKWIPNFSQSDFDLLVANTDTKDRLKEFTPKDDSVAAKKRKPSITIKAGEIMTIAKSLSVARHNIAKFIGRNRELLTGTSIKRRKY